MHEEVLGRNMKNMNVRLVWGLLVLYCCMYFISYLSILIYNTINYTCYQISKGFLDPTLSLIFQFLMDHYFDISFF